MPSTKPSPAPRLLSSPAIGAFLLIAQQFGSRALTFVVNQILLRYLSPSLLGISTQLEVYSITVLFFSRESLRVAVQRQADVIDEPLKDKEKKDKKPNGYHVESITSAGRTQALVNLSYLTILLGIIFSITLGILYLHTLTSSQDQTILQTPYFTTSLTLYGISSIWELLAEPCYVVVQQKSRFEIRASAEWTATLSRCLITCGITIWAFKSGIDLGVLAFAIGQCVYASSLSLIYFSSVWRIAKNGGFSLFTKPIHSNNPQEFLLTYLSRPLLTLTTSFFSQSLIKHLLTQGDTLLISLLATPQSQGIYALANNYGGLIARLLLQPIEESSRNYFGKILSLTVSPSSSTSSPQAISPNSKNLILQAKSNLTLLLRSYTILSIPLISIAPFASPLLLTLIAGSHWTSSGAGSVLSLYCYYIPLLSLNGILEAFVSSISTETQIHIQTLYMSLFSLLFALSAWVFLGVLDMGARGLVCANAFNMFMRILWCWRFIGVFMRGREVSWGVGEIMPRGGSVAVGMAAWGVLRRLEEGFEGGVLDFVKIGGVAGVLVVMIGIIERKFILECFRALQGSKTK